MKIVILANSFREGGRCIAGIELDSRNKPVISGNRPRWVRPVCKTAHEEVPTELAAGLSLLDIVEFEPKEFNPNRHQSENVLIDNRPFEILGTFPKESIPTLCDNARFNTIFINRGKAVPEDKLPELNYSLILIGVENCKVINRTYEDKLFPQIRLGFRYHTIEYDLPITDPFFLYEYHAERVNDITLRKMFLTISLGAGFEKWAYKLIAGILY